MERTTITLFRQDHVDGANEGIVISAGLGNAGKEPGLVCPILGLRDPRVGDSE
jgi:hypothetical protein